MERSGGESRSCNRRASLHRKLAPWCVVGEWHRIPPSFKQSAVEVREPFHWYLARAYNRLACRDRGISITHRKGSKSMSRVAPTTLGKRLVLALAVALMLILGCAALAQAQTSFGAQYGSPTSSGQRAIEHTGSSAAEPDDAPGIGVLPSTGGLPLPLIASGVLLLGAAGIIVAGRRRR